MAMNGHDDLDAARLRGTMIRTPEGELPVEKLRAGKQVITLVDGREVAKTVSWLGRRRVDLARHARPETAAPIRIRRDAFAAGMPHRDLLLRRTMRSSTTALPREVGEARHPARRGATGGELH